jgi:hypothetical protein
MDKPPRTPPRQRWYHRWVLTEQGAGEPLVLSYHVLLWGAESCKVQLIVDQADAFLEHEGPWWNIHRLARPC